MNINPGQVNETQSLDYFAQVKDFVANFNITNRSLLPMKLRYHSSLDKQNTTKPLAMIIGELHLGAEINTPFAQIDYYRSSQTIIKFLLELFRAKTSILGNALKEGFSEISLSTSYEQFSERDFLMNRVSTAAALKNLLARENIDLDFVPGESEALLTKSALLSYLLCGFPGESVSTEIEQGRILEIIRSFSDAALERMQIQLRELRKELFLDREPLANIVRKVKVADDLDLISLRHPALIEGYSQEIEDLKYLCKSKLKQLCLERDKFMSIKYINAFGQSHKIHPILVGELHVQNLIKLLEEQGIFCIYLSVI